MVWRQCLVVIEVIAHGNKGSTINDSLCFNMDCMEGLLGQNLVVDDGLHNSLHSNIPPMCGADGGLKYQVIPSWANLLTICSLFNNLKASASSLSAPTKLLPLSERIDLGFPLLPRNLLRAIVNESVVRSPANSR